jgi:hypothetical protein
LIIFKLFARAPDTLVVHPPLTPIWRFCVQAVRGVRVMIPGEGCELSFGITPLYLLSTISSTIPNSSATVKNTAM